MRIMSKEQISELLTRMVEQHAPDEDLAVVIRYSAAYILGRRALDKTCQEYGLYRYLATCVPSLSEVSSKLATLIAKNDCDLDAEHMLAFGNQLLEFYKDLEAYGVELYFIKSDNPWHELKRTKDKPKDTFKTDRYYQTGVVSGHSKIYELLEKTGKEVDE